MKTQLEQLTWIEIPGDVFDEGAIKGYIPGLVKTQVLLEIVEIDMDLKPFSDAASLVDIHHMHLCISFLSALCPAMDRASRV